MNTVTSDDKLSISGTSFTIIHKMVAQRPSNSFLCTIICKSWIPAITLLNLMHRFRIHSMILCCHIIPFFLQNFTKKESDDAPQIQECPNDKVVDNKAKRNKRKHGGYEQGIKDEEKKDL